MQVWTLDSERVGKIAEWQWAGKKYGPAQMGTTSGAPLECLALARLGGFLHLPFFGHNRDVQQAERQNHHHEYECHGLNVSP